MLAFSQPYTPPKFGCRYVNIEHAYRESLEPINTQKCDVFVGPMIFLPIICILLLVTIFFARAFKQNHFKNKTKNKLGAAEKFLNRVRYVLLGCFVALYSFFCYETIYSTFYGPLDLSIPETFYDVSLTAILLLAPILFFVTCILLKGTNRSSISSLLNNALLATIASYFFIALNDYVKLTALEPKAEWLGLPQPYGTTYASIAIVQAVLMVVLLAMHYLTKPKASH